MRTCFVCGKVTNKLCGNCRAVAYCSQPCQKCDRPRHRKCCFRWADPVRIPTGNGGHWEGSLLSLTDPDDESPSDPAPLRIVETLKNAGTLGFSPYRLESVGMMVQWIGPLPSLTHLDISDGDMGCTGAVALASLLTICPSLEELIIEDTAFDDIGFIRIAANLVNLKKIIANKCKFGHVGWAALTDALGTLVSLRRLELNWNHIGDQGLESLSCAFARGAARSLESLRIRESKIGPDGFRAFVAACACGALPELEELDISLNDMGDHVCTAFADACASGALPSLGWLELSGSNIGHPGYVAIARSLDYGALPLLKYIEIDDEHARIKKRGKRKSKPSKIAAACSARGIEMQSAREAHDAFTQVLREAHRDGVF